MKCPICQLAADPNRCSSATAFLAGVAFVMTHCNEAVKRILCAPHAEHMLECIRVADRAIAAGDRRVRP